MSNWKEIAISGSSPNLKSAFLSGTTTASMEANGNYYPTASNLWLNNFSGDNDDWKTNDDNLNDNGDSWISSTRTVVNQNGSTSTHKSFDVLGLSPACLPTTITTNANPQPGEIKIQNNNVIFLDGFQNSIDYTAYFNSLVLLESYTGSYTLTDGTNTASYQITNVESFSNNNYKVYGNFISGAQLNLLATGPAEICLPGLEASTTGTGASHGITPSTSSNALNVEQTLDTKYLYAETSDTGENTYSITSPFIDITDYATKKLVFYFHLHGPNCGNFKVYSSASPGSLAGSSTRVIQYSNWPSSETGNLPGGTQATSYFSGGTNNPYLFTYAVGPGEVQTHVNSTFNRAEVSLTSFNIGYIWIVYESGNPGIDLEDSPADAPKADFAIGNLYLDLGGYLQPEQFAVVAETPTLEVKNDFVRFVNLPLSDPLVLGALYKDPSNLTGIRSQVRISNGP